MGIAVTVLSILGELDTNTAITMPGIGVACAGVSLLERNRRGRYVARNRSVEVVSGCR